MWSPLKRIMVEYRALIVRMYFDHDKSRFVCEKLEPHIMYVVPIFHTMWLGIDLGFAMFHGYVGGSSYLHKICLALKCLYYYFCKCDESYRSWIFPPFYDPMFDDFNKLLQQSHDALSLPWCFNHVGFKCWI